MAGFFAESVLARPGFNSQNSPHMADVVSTTFLLRENVLTRKQEMVNL